MRNWLIGCGILVGAVFSEGAMAQQETTDIEALIAEMSIEEKAGQMTQLSLEIVSKGDGYNVQRPHELDIDKLKNVIVDHHVGSILNCAGEPHTPARWAEMIGQMQQLATQQTRLGIPLLYGIDAIHGTNYTKGATLYPQEVGLAASWNPELVEQAAAMTAYETRASSIPWTFSPDVDLGIDPRWARMWEGFGEDPHLSATMGVAMTKGFEGEDVSAQDRVAACLKHFVGYGAPRSGKDRTPAWIPETMLRELFLPPFQAAIDAGAKSIMINSGEVNGVPVHASSWLLTDVLRTEMGFEGVVVTDWYDIWNLVERHHIAKDRREAVKISIMAGIDMSMVPMDLEFTAILIDLIKTKEIPMSRIDDAVRKILMMKKELGLFEKPVMNPKDYPLFGSEQHRQIAENAALESITLLKNDAVLPLDIGQKLLVVGPNGNSLRSMNGGWSYTWQGEQTDEYAKGHDTFYEALKRLGGNKKVDFEAGVAYVEGKDFKHETMENIDLVKQKAEKADVIILCLGENSYTEKPGDLDDLNLSEPQLALAEAVLKTQKPVVLVLNEGRPRIISKIADRVDAVVQTYLPGNEGGIALAKLLFGQENFSGKLPYTYPRYSNDLLPYYHKYSEDLAHNDGNVYEDPFFNPQYEFGYGLSYSTFGYSNLQVAQSQLSADDQLEISIKVTNTGKMDGKEVVQLYSSDIYASVTPSVKRLRAYKKIAIKAGETKSVTFKLPMKDLAFVGQNNKWTLEPGEFKITVGDQAVMINLKGQVTTLQ